jgi:hypothetical protein
MHDKIRFNKNNKTLKVKKLKIKKKKIYQVNFVIST